MESSIQKPSKEILKQVLGSASGEVQQPSRGVTNGTGSTANSYVGGLRACCTFGNTGGVSTDAFNIASVAHTGVAIS
jgi:hypothetical protein